MLQIINFSFSTISENLGAYYYKITQTSPNVSANIMENNSTNSDSDMELVICRQKMALVPLM